MRFSTPAGLPVGLQIVAGRCAIGSCCRRRAHSDRAPVGRKRPAVAQ
jgi:hypothetical protein